MASTSTNAPLGWGIRILALATGVMTAVSCFWISVLWLPLPFLLIIGSFIASTLPRVGEWLMWIGAVLLSISLFPIYIWLLRHPEVPVDQYDINGMIIMAVTVTSVILVPLFDAALIRVRLKRNPGAA